MYHRGLICPIQRLRTHLPRLPFVHGTALRRARVRAQGIAGKFLECPESCKR